MTDEKAAPLPAPAMSPKKIEEYIDAVRHAMDRVDGRTNNYRSLSELRDWLVEELGTKLLAAAGHPGGEE